MGFTFFPSFIALVHKNPSYVEYTRYLQYIANLCKSTIDGHKNNSTMVSNALLGFYSRSMKSIVAFSQCFIMGVNLRLIQKKLKEDLLFLARGFCAGVLPS